MLGMCPVWLKMMSGCPSSVKKRRGSAGGSRVSSGPRDVHDHARLALPANKLVEVGIVAAVVRHLPLCREVEGRELRFSRQVRQPQVCALQREEEAAASQEECQMRLLEEQMRRERAGRKDDGCAPDDRLPPRVVALDELVLLFASRHEPVHHERRSASERRCRGPKRRRARPTHRCRQPKPTWSGKTSTLGLKMPPAYGSIKLMKPYGLDTDSMTLALFSDCGYDALSDDAIVVDVSTASATCAVCPRRVRSREVGVMGTAGSEGERRRYRRMRVRVMAARARRRGGTKPMRERMDA